MQRHPRSLLLALGALTAFGPLSLDVYLPSLPQLGSDLGASESLTQFTLSACMIGLALGQLLWGPISDRYGRRMPLFIAITGFIVTSLLCAVAPTIEVLIGIRIVQGLCGAAGMVIARAVVHDLFSGAEAVAAYSTLAAVLGITPVLAPLVGGGIALVSDWRGVFVTLAVIGALLLAVAALAVPETHAPDDRTAGGIRNDFRGIGAALTNGPFMLAAATLGLASIALFSYLQMSPFVLQQQYGLSPQGFALVFAANSVGILAAATLNRRLARRAPAQRVVRWSLSIAAAAAIAVLLAGMLDSSLPWLLVPLFVVMSSHGINNPSLTALGLGQITRSAGSASAVLGTVSMLLGALVPPLVSLFGVSAAVLGGTMLAALVGALVLLAVASARGARNA
ncbi:multidrug effflux MFS transporter [Microbacterium esteraromaticum]|uniref:Multidrug effflux MFS transporter n=1 Tax=Microbacterium esteraromaticum TaxID=57043 RepID=A0A939IQ72_9MICO|nr:multidrug effflux MFS transporter [Microbacterium esteraromaticum]MBN8204365.1 multidrug effflux MFS transporter [Microbacterium esteraromaticum]MBN8414519.1 multidrug effflux MFS transporter [Microbacterium esteraromaticum]WDH78528.1 multidrug effflux MFS transporter [Microbacterium esteraromaticum]